jgi:hypothetical protein
MEINMIGGGFQHSISSTGCENKYVKWVKNNHTASISIYIDYSILEPPNSNTKNYGWLCESKTIIPDAYKWAANHYEQLEKNFIKVFTHDVSLTEISNVFHLVQCSGKSIIPEKDYKIYDKTKLISIIASNKIFCNEHIYRQEIVSKYRKKCDTYGRGYNEIKNKIDGLKDYCFSISMENATYPNMFTEKISDCFVTGTVPIYYGMKEINKIFNEKGIIFLDENFDIDTLSFDLYHSMKPYIIENYEIACSLLTAEDYIYVNFLKNNT